MYWFSASFFLSLSLSLSLSPPSCLCLQSIDDYEYRPELEDSDEEDLDVERKDTGKSKGAKNNKKKLRTGLLIAGAPVTLHQYQSTLKEKLEHLHGHRQREGEGKGAEQGKGALTSASWPPMTEDWIRVPNRCVQRNVRH